MIAPVEAAGTQELKDDDWQGGRNIIMSLKEVVLVNRSMDFFAFMYRNGYSPRRHR